MPLATDDEVATALRAIAGGPTALAPDASLTAAGHGPAVMAELVARGLAEYWPGGRGRGRGDYALTPLGVWRARRVVEERWRHGEEVPVYVIPPPPGRRDRRPIRPSRFGRNREVPLWAGDRARALIDPAPGPLAEAIAREEAEQEACWLLMGVEVRIDRRMGKTPPVRPA